MRWFLRSKIHQATVTEADINYIGSITIDKALLDKVGMLPGERVQVVDNTNGARLETYIIAAETGSGTICINGAAAHLIDQGDGVIIMGYELSDQAPEPLAVLVDENNAFVRYLD